MNKSNESLADTHPHIAEQWHSIKNGDLVPSMVTYGSHKKVWWKCPKGDDHEWEARVQYRTRDNRGGCPICSDKKIVLSNCLATTHPDIAKQWHPTKNHNTPYDVGSGSDKKVWWKCEKNDNHIWETRVINRKTNECPFCINQKVDLSNCLANTHPELSKQWHPTKNKNTPYDVVSGSDKKVWWKCEKNDNHIWETRVFQRGIRGTKCPFCINQKVDLSNCLANTHPELSKQWHPTKNKNTPYDVVSGSDKKVWWKCPKGDDHEWEARVQYRTRDNRGGCPICSGQKIVLSNCLATTHPDIAKQWHPTKNKNTPYDIVSGSNKKVWWKCPKGDDHEWETRVSHRTRDKCGCPICSGNKIVLSNCLATTHPDIAKEWHPTKNHNTPYDVGSGSHQKVWWKCEKNDNHVWETRVVKRGIQGTKCPFCINQKVNLSNCLAATHPELSKQWHPTKNKNTPYDVVSGSDKKVWWKCPKGTDHVWEAQINSRARNGTGCPVCSNKKTTISNCLAITHPHIAEQWHPTKNKNTPYDVVWGCNEKVWWKCKKGDDHEWEAKIVERAKESGTSCPICANLKTVLSNCLATTHPDIAKEWHPSKNHNTPYDVGSGSHQKVWWKCEKNDNHIWETRVINRGIQGTKCPFCINQKVDLSNCLATTHPELSKQWHPTKNHNTPYDVGSGSHQKVWWKCEKNDNHVWETRVINRGIKGTKCPFCINQKVDLSNCLATTYPDIAKEWHPTKNHNTPYDVVWGSKKKVWWKCEKNDDHAWIASITNRTKQNGTSCPYCNSGWTISKIRLFVQSLLPHLDNLSPAELYVIFQQNGVSPQDSKGKSFLQALKTGKFPKDELERFVKEQQSLVDEFISDPLKSIDELNERESSLCISEDSLSSVEEEFPIIETKDILSTLDSKLISNIDKEAIEFFISSATAKIWSHAFYDEYAAVKQLEKNSTSPYAQEVKNMFLEQYYGAKNLFIPTGYNFKKNGNLCTPNLMQRFTAYMLMKQKRLGNWSGTGAGKTLSAVLASRVIDANLTIICCPNNVISGWQENIKSIYADSYIFVKDTDFISAQDKHNYLILNYEFFQQAKSESKLKNFIEKNKIDLVVIDEIHYSKQREVENISKRKKVISAMLSEASVRNENLHVLGMSATPVINNLFEGKTLIELITGVHHDELNTQPSVANCIALYQKLVSNGIRWLPKYNQRVNVQPIEIDCSEYLTDIRRISPQGTMVDLEAILTLAKLPTVIKHIKQKTIIYTHYLKNILEPLKNAVENAGWKTSIYSGDDKSGLEDFLKYDADVLIATSCLATGVDGLQEVCNRVIINTLPWTHAEFEQLKGRVYRQGQKADYVDIIVPLTFANINGERWSWCDSRWKRIQFKKSIADAAVDGIIPEGHLRTPSQAYQDIMNWLQRLEDGNLIEIERQRISISLSDNEIKNGLKKFGDFSQMNRQLNTASSSVTHQRFKANPQDWEYYHTMYREARKHWPVIPYKEAVRWCQARPHLIIGDFGCGEALIAKEVENKIYSLDHVAVNEDVIVCDMSHTPLDDESLDAAIFSLSLMGSNYIDYIKEAHRCLKLDGNLWVAETTSRFQKLNLFEKDLVKLGFDIVRVHEKANFTFLRAIKSDRTPSS